MAPYAIQPQAQPDQQILAFRGKLHCRKQFGQCFAIAPHSLQHISQHFPESWFGRIRHHCSAGMFFRCLVIAGLQADGCQISAGIRKSRINFQCFSQVSFCIGMALQGHQGTPAKVVNLSAFRMNSENGLAGGNRLIKVVGIECFDSRAETGQCLPLTLGACCHGWRLQQARQQIFQYAHEYIPEIRLKSDLNTARGI